MATLTNTHIFKHPTLDLLFYCHIVATSECGRYVKVVLDGINSAVLDPDTLEEADAAIGEDWNCGTNELTAI